MNGKIRKILHTVQLAAMAPAAVLAVALAVAVSACSSDDGGEAPKSELAQAAEWLTGETVLNACVYMNGVNMTVLDSGCPTKFTFRWDDSQSHVAVELLGFSVGKMPLKIDFRADAAVGGLTSFDTQEYKGEGWIAFSGKGTTSVTGMGKDTGSSDSSVKGYYNVKTRQITLDINFNVMNVSLNCPPQTVDRSRLDRFDDDMTQYLLQLEAYKQEHGQQ